MPKKMGEILIEKGLVTQDNLAFALELQRNSKMPLGEILLANNLLPERDLYSALAEQSGQPFVESITVDQIDLGSLDEDDAEAFRLMKQHVMAPLREGKMVVSDPEVGRQFMLAFGPRELVIAPPSTILTALEEWFIARIDRDIKKGRPRGDESASDFVDVVIRKALVARASDIHFEAAWPTCYVRFRIDGDPILQLSYSRDLHAAVANVLLTRSKGHPANDIKFDDSSFEFTVSSTSMVSLRLSKIPTNQGPGIVLRILRKDHMLIPLDNLGFLPDQVSQLKRLARRSYGMVLLTGPTGAGKTTTLYAMTNEVRGTGTKTLSIEDPIEVSIPFINQVQVNPDSGVTFGSAIKHFLRQDPDVMLIGEIRDEETAYGAFEAAMTGHLVLSSVHANTVFDVLPRLRDLGVSFAKMAGLLCIVNQRLVKRRCASCQGNGCGVCGGTGCHGRVVVAEILELTDRLRGHLYREDLPGFIEAAQNGGFVPIQEVAERYLGRGLVSPQNVWRAVGERRRRDEVGK